jgi:hypothetical protein
MRHLVLLMQDFVASPVDGSFGSPASARSLLQWRRPSLTRVVSGLEANLQWDANRLKEGFAKLS